MKIFSTICCLVISSITVLFSNLLYQSSNDPLDCLGGIFQSLNNYACKKHKLEAIGTSISSPDGILMSAGMHFQFNKQLSKQEYKVMMNDLKNHLLNSLNNDKNIASCMNQFPFDEKNIDITIFLDDGDREFFYPEYRIVSLEYGKFVFYTKDPALKYGYKTREEEKYNSLDFTE